MGDGVHINKAIAKTKSVCIVYNKHKFQIFKSFFVYWVENSELHINLFYIYTHNGYRWDKKLMWL